MTNLTAADARAALEAEVRRIVDERCALAAQPCEFCEREVAALMALADAAGQAVAGPLEAETTRLRADLADAEAEVARWPRCPAGCRCRVGTDDADALECGCVGPCTAGWGAPKPAVTDMEPLHGLAAKWDANAARNQRNGQSLLDQGDEYGSEGLAVAEALGACVVDLRAVLADYEPAGDSVADHPDGCPIEAVLPDGHHPCELRRGHDGDHEFADEGGYANR